MGRVDKCDHMLTAWQLTLQKGRQINSGIRRYLPLDKYIYIQCTCSASESGRKNGCTAVQGGYHWKNSCQISSRTSETLQNVKQRGSPTSGRKTLLNVWSSNTKEAECNKEVCTVYWWGGRQNLDINAKNVMQDSVQHHASRPTTMKIISDCAGLRWA
jgi:hypothetical protein